MYWVGVLALILVFILVFSFLGSSGILLNLGSLFIICIIVFPLLIFSGQFNYFLLGIKIAVRKVKKAPSGEVKKVIIAVKLAINLTLLSGLIGFLTGGILILSNLSTVKMLGQSAALATISLLYALFCISFLLPVKAKAEAFMIDSLKAEKDFEMNKGACNE